MPRSAAKGNVGGDVRREPARRARRSAAARARARRSAVIERAWPAAAIRVATMSHAECPTTEHERCLSQGRPRAASRRWRCAGREARRRHHQCRLHAGLSRPARHHRAADRRRRRRACRTGSTAMSMRRRTIRSAAGCRDVAAVLGERARDGPRADPRRRHRALFQGADEGLAAVPPIPPDIRADVRGRLASEGVARALRRTAAARSADRASADAERPLAHRARAGGGAGDRPLAVRLAPRRHAAAARPARTPPRCFSPASARNWCARIEARFDAMLEAGALDEVRALAARDLDPLCRR